MNLKKTIWPVGAIALVLLLAKFSSSDEAQNESITNDEQVVDMEVQPSESKSVETEKDSDPKLKDEETSETDSKPKTDESKLLAQEPEQLEAKSKEVSDGALEPKKEPVELAVKSDSIDELSQPEVEDDPELQKETASSDQTLTDKVDEVEVDKPLHRVTSYTVKSGDALGRIFSERNIDYSTLLNLMEADQYYLKLDSIKPGDKIEFVVNTETDTLDKFVYIESLFEKSVYTLSDDGEYDYELIESETEWKTVLYTGVIEGSFYISAKKSGLSNSQIATITRVLNPHIDFVKDIRKGDEFRIWIDEQYAGEKRTINAEVKAIEVDGSRKEISAFAAEDGRFYDRDGTSLEAAFDRYPVDEQYRRVTSHFNPRRKHPVTGRVTPHNGTDFASPVGAPIYATGDGQVIAVKNHRYAGKYVVIQHNDVYKTRYLHLHDFAVKKGDVVKRGDVIGRSGATGRITGPHLHYEVLVRNRAVDPMKVSLPEAKDLSEQNRDGLVRLINEFDSLVLARLSSKTNS